MKVANFVAYYTDETEATHCLSLSEYGETENLAEDGRWVLIEPVS